MSKENYSSSSSSFASTNSGSTFSSSPSTGSFSTSGAVTVTTAVSSSSTYENSGDFGSSATVSELPISNSVTSAVISSGMSRGFASTVNSKYDCCSTPPAFAHFASPVITSGTAASISSLISTT